MGERYDVVIEAHEPRRMGADRRFGRQQRPRHRRAVRLRGRARDRCPAVRVADGAAQRTHVGLRRSRGTRAWLERLDGRACDSADAERPHDGRHRVDHQRCALRLGIPDHDSRGRAHPPAVPERQHGAASDAPARALLRDRRSGVGKADRVGEGHGARRADGPGARRLRGRQPGTMVDALSPRVSHGSRHGAADRYR